MPSSRRLGVNPIPDLRLFCESSWNNIIPSEYRSLVARSNILSDRGKESGWTFQTVHPAPFLLVSRSSSSPFSSLPQWWHPHRTSAIPFHRQMENKRQLFRVQKQTQHTNNSMVLSSTMLSFPSQTLQLGNGSAQRLRSTLKSSSHRDLIQ